MLKRNTTVFRWLLSKRIGFVILLVFLLCTLRLLMNFERKLEEMNGQLSDSQRNEFVKNGGNMKTFGKFDTQHKLPNRTGLTVKNAEFYLNGKPFRILGGSIHYFRIPSEYWRARLLALKASGLNTVTTYVPWNAHEPVKRKYDFSDMLQLTKFLQIANDLDIVVILRVGPYICAEWEWGGLPSWLLREPKIRVRTSDPVYMKHVQEWFSHLLSVVAPYQYRYGGAIVAVQVENEYASFPDYDPDYVVQLAEMISAAGIQEFLFACDDKNGVLGLKLDYGGLMKSINFQHNPADIFKQLKAVQPNWPLFVSEYWTGWFNWWGGPNNNRGVPWSHSLDTAKFEQNTKEILDSGGHMNMYMFVGGTNFGFLNGGMIEPNQRGNSDKTAPDTTSYDYDALITEEGKLTPKFYVTRKLIQALQPNSLLPEPPPDPKLVSYSQISVESFITLSDLVTAFGDWFVKSKQPIPMEMLPSNPERSLGQAYGYTIYETDLSPASLYKLNLDRKIRDRAIIFLDGVHQGTVHPPMGEVSIKAEGNSKHTLRFVVENQGRINWVSRDQPGIYQNQRKGIVDDITCNGEILTDWKILPIEFDSGFLKKLQHLTSQGVVKWQKNTDTKTPAPAVLKATLRLDSKALMSTFIELENFEKGIVIVNGRNMGRYWNSAGPQRRLFLPGVWLHEGDNEILIFEESKVGDHISFYDTSAMQ